MKKTQLVMAVQFLFYIMMLSSCKKDTIKQSVPATEYFPNKVGNYWEYAVYDSSQIRERPDMPRQYEVKVKIIGTKKLIDNLDAMIWKYEYPWGDEIKYYRLINDSLKVYDEVRASDLSYIPYPNDLFIKPFFVGQKWKSDLLWTDSFFVKGDVIQNYKDVFSIQRNYIGQQTYYNNEWWFSQRIGFIKLHRDEVNQGIRISESWTLKYYNLK